MYDIINLEKQAIDAAIASDWKTATKLNEQIIELDKKNVDAYMRLGFVYLQECKFMKAKLIYRKALKLQPGNYIITQNLEKIKILESKKSTQVKNLNLNPYLFLEIPGKTKIVSLVNCGQKSILARLNISQPVVIVPKKRRIEIRTQDKEYLGCLPDDLSKRLSIFLKAGSEFSCYIKEAGLKNIVIFLKEEKKGRRVAKYASFPINIQSNLDNLAQGHEEIREDLKEDDLEELTDNDLEKIAESLGEDNKEYLGYDPEDKDEESEE